MSTAMLSFRAFPSLNAAKPAKMFSGVKLFLQRLHHLLILLRQHCARVE
jgi:hypothetical protein